MVIYKYIEDWFEDSSDSGKFCKEQGIIYFKPSKNRKAWLKKWLKSTKLPKIETKKDIICYWRDHGTWGMYHPEDNSISICPYRIDEAGGLEEVIRHEIAHLNHPEANDLNHTDKEHYINNIS